MFRSLACLAVLLSLASAISFGQTTTQISPSATTLASQSLQAAVGSTTLTDVTLQGTVNYTAGSDEESGTFTLEVKGNQESKLMLNLTSGQRQEIRQGQLGAWVDSVGVQHAIAPHNCWVDASVLFPTFSVWGVLNDPQIRAVYVERTVLNGVTVDHLQLTRAVPTPTSGVNPIVQGLSAMDLYLDPSSHLPVELDFNTHPDDDLMSILPVSVVLSGYQKMGGIVLPTHIQKLVQGTLMLDCFVSSATINSGILDSDFSISVPQGGN